MFNPKTTEWMLSYDGRNQEPVTLPVKFPLLLAQGVEGIAVGLASKILPHNFNELIDASIAYLRGEPFELYPDFPSGGLCDVTRYNDGLRGGAVKVRARINKIDKRTLAITELPYCTTTESIKESIIKANDKGKIKIKKVDDNTSDQVEIIIHVSNDESSDRTIDALYAFTDCEVSISPNSCVIMDDKPHFMGVHEILRRCADRTRELLRRELEIRLEELEQDWHMSSLEKIFIENKIYQRMEEATSREAAYAAVDEGLKPFAHLLRREITLDDVVKLTELRMIRISRYDSFKADEHVKSVEQEIAQVKRHLATLTDFTIAYFRRIKEKYGRGRERRTELREFDSIEATKVVVANAKLYVDRAEGFFGIGPAMRKDEFVCDCSDIDDVIVVTKEGKYVITKVSEKAFFAKNIYYIGIFKRNDERTIYNVLYRDGRGGPLLGFATANMDIRGLVMPPPAIYATSVSRTASPVPAEDGCTEIVPPPAASLMPSMTSFGHNPTFGEGALTLETHILDFSEDIYGSELELVFFRKLRDEMRFSGPEELVAQLAADREARRACGLEGDFRERC